MTANDIESPIKALASTRLDSKPKTSLTVVKPSNPSPVQVPYRPSLITSDAAGDALAADLSRINLNETPASTPIHVRFYSMRLYTPIGDPILIHARDTDSLLDPVRIMLRRRSLLFRQHNLTKTPAFQWRFTVKYKYIEDDYDANEGALEGKIVVRKRFSETCTGTSDTTYDEIQDKGNTVEAHQRFLEAIKDQEAMTQFLNGGEAGKLADNIETPRQSESVFEGTDGEQDEEVSAGVDVYFR